jgi:2-polyprenyl-6-methoxyphenol hydroxylase-like FAD-dependent oxidoreductase
MGIPGSFDVIVVGGGMAGGSMAGVLARAGLGVLVVEKEPRFRDRVRGEATLPWGVAAALRVGLGEMLEAGGRRDLPLLQVYEDRRVASSDPWAAESVDGLPQISFLHPSMQEAAFAWAAAGGATALRPAKAVRFEAGVHPRVWVVDAHDERAYTARLVVAADGKQSAARAWTGGETVTDPEHHRFGGVLVSGLRVDDLDGDNLAGSGTIGVDWFANSDSTWRLYLVGLGDELRRSRADRSFDAFLATMAEFMPIGSTDGARQEGPLAFFPNSCTWATRVTGHGVALVGDAAGAADPTQGHGTSLLFRDVAELSELLLGDREWAAAVAEFGRRRDAYYAVVRAYDRWKAPLEVEDADSLVLRESHELAKQADPTLGGWMLVEARGPDGLVPDEAARRTFYGLEAAPTSAGRP